MSYANTFARKEVKYLLSAEQVYALQAAMAETMEQDEYGLSTIHNIYFDSPDYLQLRRSAEKPMYKEKVRLRRYGGSGNAFLELKKKYDGIVYKRRVELPLPIARIYLGSRLYPSRFDCQQLRELDYTIRHWNLNPRIYLAYDRMAYFGREDVEFRMTLDRNIRYRTKETDFDSAAPCTPVLEPGQALLEIKANGAYPAWLIRFLSQNRIYPVSFSKVGRVYETLIQNKELEFKCLKVS